VRTATLSRSGTRHAFITAALDAGVPLRDVQEAASHADPRTTMRYDRAAEGEHRPAEGHHGDEALGPDVGLACRIHG
jgi:integrase